MVVFILFLSVSFFFIFKEKSTEPEAGTSTGKKKKKGSSASPDRKSHVASVDNDAQPSSNLASVYNDPALDGEAASVEVIPSDLASQVATRHQTVLPTGGYVLHAVPLSEDKTPMVQDISFVITQRS